MQRHPSAGASLLIAGALVLVPVLPASAASSTLTVCASPAATYTTIQSAVDAATDGDMIDVCAGVFDESVTITKKHHAARRTARYRRSQRPHEPRG